MSNQNETYLGNPKIKRDGVQMSYTHKQLQEYIKCSNDPAYFACNYMKVIHMDHGLVPFELYDYQHKLINHLNDNRFSIVLACRQSGKSITSIAYLLHTILFKPDQKVAILANKGAIAKEMLGRLTLALENIPFFLQPGCKALNKTSIELSNNSSIVSASTSSSSIRGLSCVPDYTRVCVLLDNNDIYYTTIKNANYINKNESKFIEEKQKKDNKRYHFVYKTINTVNGKEYIGYHGTNNLDDGYLGSGILLRKAIEKYGPEAFKREVLEYFDKPEDAYAHEKIRKTAEKHRGMKRSEESKVKLSLAKKGKIPHNIGKIYIHNPETKEKRMIMKNESIPEGFKRGYLKK